MLLFLKKDASDIFFEALSPYRKKLVARAKRRERIYKRTAEPSVTFCGEEEQRNGRLIFCVVISKNRKKLLTTVQRCECVYKRAAERSDTFCGEEKQWSG